METATCWANRVRLESGSQRTVAIMTMGDEHSSNRWRDYGNLAVAAFSASLMACAWKRFKPDEST